MTRIWILVGALAAAAFPGVAAAERTDVCQNDEARASIQERAEPTMQQQPLAPSRPLVTQREGGEQGARAEAPRRRFGKRVPDAELIGPRGAL